MTDVQVVTFEAWAARNGRVGMAEVDAHIHAGLRSKPTTKTYQRFHDNKLAELQKAREVSRRDYQIEVASGRVREPTRLESLRQTAAGQPDNPSVMAARRLLAKHDARYCE